MSLPELDIPVDEIVGDDLRAVAQLVTGLVDGVAAAMEQHPDTENFTARYQVANAGWSEEQAEVRLLLDLVLGVIAADCEPEHYETYKNLVIHDIALPILDGGRMMMKDLADALGLAHMMGLTRLWQRRWPERGNYKAHFAARQAERAEQRV